MFDLSAEHIEDLKRINSEAWKLAERYAELSEAIQNSDLPEETKEKLEEHFEYPEAAVPLDMWHSALNELWHSVTGNASRTVILTEGLKKLEEMDEDTLQKEFRR